MWYERVFWVVLSILIILALDRALKRKEREEQNGPRGRC